MRNELEEFPDGEWDWPYLDGYTGPYYSDGRFQASVAFGKTKPRTKLAKCSRDHDTRYNLCKRYADDIACFDHADDAYVTCTSNLGFIPRSIGKIPKYVHSYGRGRKIRMGNTQNRLDRDIKDAEKKAAAQSKRLRAQSDINKIIKKIDDSVKEGKDLLGSTTATNSGGQSGSGSADPPADGPDDDYVAQAVKNAEQARQSQVNTITNSDTCVTDGFYTARSTNEDINMYDPTAMIYNPYQRIKILTRLRKLADRKRRKRSSTVYVC